MGKWICALFSAFCALVWSKMNAIKQSDWSVLRQMVNLESGLFMTSSGCIRKRGGNLHNLNCQFNSKWISLFLDHFIFYQSNSFHYGIDQKNMQLLVRLAELNSDIHWHFVKLNMLKRGMKELMTYSISSKFATLLLSNVVLYVSRATTKWLK